MLMRNEVVMHVETIVLLSKGCYTSGGRVFSNDRNGAKRIDSRKVKVEFSLEDMDLSESKGKATYAQIKEYVFNETGLKVSSLYIAQVKKKCGLDVGENFNLPKSEGAKGPVDLCSARTEVETKTAKQPQVTPEKEEAILQAFRYYGMI